MRVDHRATTITTRVRTRPNHCDNVEQRPPLFCRACMQRKSRRARVYYLALIACSMQVPWTASKECHCQNAEFVYRIRLQEQIREGKWYNLSQVSSCTKFIEFHVILKIIQ